MPLHQNHLWVRVSRLERVQVGRVPVERILDSPMTSRYNSDTLVIPVMEEVLLIEKSCSSKRKYASPNM